MMSDKDYVISENINTSCFAEKAARFFQKVARFFKKVARFFKKVARFFQKAGRKKTSQALGRF